MPPLGGVFLSADCYLAEFGQEQTLGIFLQFSYSSRVGYRSPQKIEQHEWLVKKAMCNLRFDVPPELQDVFRECNG